MFIAECSIRVSGVHDGTKHCFLGYRLHLLRFKIKWKSTASLFSNIYIHMLRSNFVARFAGKLTTFGE